MFGFRSRRLRGALLKFPALGSAFGPWRYFTTQDQCMPSKARFANPYSGGVAATPLVDGSRRPHFDSTTILNVTPDAKASRSGCSRDDDMRKGFTRKPQADEPATPVKNYITPGGLQRLKEEHRFLLTRERPAVTKVVAWAASNGDRSENADYQYGKRRLRQIDGRLRFLTKRIDAAEVVDPERPRAGQAATRAFFGATVRFANAAGTERVVSIVGTDEVDLNRNHISWVSPLGRALMKSAAGDRVALQAPGGTEYLIVLEVCYERISVEPFREPPGAEASAKELPR